MELRNSDVGSRIRETFCTVSRELGKIYGWPGTHCGWANALADLLWKKVIGLTVVRHNTTETFDLFFWRLKTCCIAVVKVEATEWKVFFWVFPNRQSKSILRDESTD
jgi:hypothetical protein